jgi:Myo-inositol-1-phosphate synthase.
VLDLALFMDFAHRAGMKGIQEWLSFYFKSPMAARGSTRSTICSFSRRS